MQAISPLISTIAGTVVSFLITYNGCYKF